MTLTINETEVIALLTALNVRAHNISQVITLQDENSDKVYISTLEAKREVIRDLYTRIVKLR